ncbi:NADH-FMN oxidoreductase RutF, flavin reductase (DIM6/NTAB) family [Terribacillus halophilus]|uniref:NADH-FMN oxidoreductase RutF, flavin reductase (DIM6/NTAB) family n=1 Tax=Terribacillus halophilus TaxID=361279 RepID=A0A1G6RIH8_9BACI|nr:flavin reductase family protein [Terribacillus halophilus]SDD04432.1 NADH-FMN oxidoreductase RutF, flavin reductase (DIM6/NTAB) family [Terribacillus halophilus]
MYTFDANNLSAKTQYKILTGSIIPRPVAFVTTQSAESDVVNAAPFSYFSIVSAAPPLISISVQRKEGRQKDTARHAIRSKELVVHISTEPIVEDLNKTAATLPAEESELDRTNLTLAPSTYVSVPGIRETSIRMECTLYDHIEIKDEEGTVTADLLLAKVVGYHLSPEVYDENTGYLDARAIQPISRLAGNDYSKLGELFTLKRPE